MISYEMFSTELRPESEAMLRRNVLDAEAAYASGEALGQPANCYIGLELDYALVEDEHTTKLSRREYREQYGRSRREVEADRGRLQTEGRGFIRRELADLPASAEQAERQSEWLGQVDRLTLPELVTYFAYRELSQPTLSETKGLMLRKATDHSIIEFKFGQSIYQAGYYDNPDAPELRTIPRGPAETLDNYDRIIEAFGRHARHYGLDFSVSGCQINFSVHDEAGRTLHSLNDPDGQETARRAAANIVVAMRDVAPALVPLLLRSTGYTAGPTRTDLLRVLPDRFEHRKQSTSRSALYASTLALMSGFARAMQTTEAPNVEGNESFACDILAQPHFLPAEGFNKDVNLHTLRALEHSTLEADGSFVLDPSYADARAINIVQSLFDSEMFGVEFGITSEVVQGLLRTVRLDDQHNLVIDPQAIQAWWQGLGSRSQYAIGYGTPHQNGPRTDLIRQRLATVRHAGTISTIRSPELSDDLSELTWHRAVARLAGSAALQPLLDASVREQLTTELAGLFTHEQAVTETVGKALRRDIGNAGWAIQIGEVGEPLFTGAAESLGRFLGECDGASLLGLLHEASNDALTHLAGQKETTPVSQAAVHLHTVWLQHIEALAASRDINLH